RHPLRLRRAAGDRACGRDTRLWRGRGRRRTVGPRRRLGRNRSMRAGACPSPAIYLTRAPSPTRAANVSQKCSVSFLAVPFKSRAPTLAIVPRTSELALHLRRDRFGGTGSISRAVLTSTPEPGALPCAVILRLLGGRTSDSSTSSWNFTFTAPTPNP